MTDSRDPETSRGKQDGRFRPGQSGNPAGRPKGARHKALMALDSMGQDSASEVMASVVKAARAGDMRAADILLRRLWPERKGRPVPFDLPELTGPENLPGAMQAVAAAVAGGELTPDEGASVAAVLESWRKAVETSDLAARIALLEQQR